MDFRPLTSESDYQACVALQRRTWGEGFHEVVPASILKITNRIGGLAAGAFEGDDLVGFVYGITGLQGGRTVHWSHMLAVRPDARDRGVGLALKQFQRAVMAERGVEAILWSFDPLVARNAWLNLVRLGARVQEYVLDMYPASDSPLHDFGTDRLIVEWDIAGGPESPRRRVPASPRPPETLIEIPADIERVARESLDVACEWRERTRAAFLDALGRGLRVSGFRRGDDGRYTYLLSPEEPGASAHPEVRP